MCAAQGGGLAEWRPYLLTPSVDLVLLEDLVGDLSRVNSGIVNAMLA